MATAQGLYSQGKTADGLTKRERQVLIGLKGDPEKGIEPMSQLAVAEALGISRQRVRQIVESLLRKGQKIEGAKPAPPLP